jgi:effector-binding domain-containing protein
MSYAVEMMEMPATRLLVVKRRARSNELSRVVPEGCGIVWNHVRQAGIKSAGRNVAVYRHADDGRLDVEVGVEIGADGSGAGEIVLSATPSGRVATVVHMGSYALLMNANNAIHEWCKANNHEIAGPSWEVYGHWSDDPAQVRTDVFYLLRR